MRKDSNKSTIDRAYDRIVSGYTPSEYVNNDWKMQDGVGYRYVFDDGSKIYLKESDNFTNYNSIPETLSEAQRISLLTQIDPGVVNTHGMPSVSTSHNQSFLRTRYKLSAGIFYILSTITQSWNNTLCLPSAVKTGLEDLGYTSVTKTQKSSLTSGQISIVEEMLLANKPVIMGGWSLFGTTESHYWVVDGIRKNNSSTHIYCNWGWDGSYNGWYSSTCIRPGVPASEHQTGNSWGNIVVYSYSKNTITPTISIHDFYDDIPVLYE